MSPQIAAEAAVWVARLHGPSRSASMERDCLAWQARSPQHREAFERCTDTWQEVPHITLASVYARAPNGDDAPPRTGSRRLRVLAVLGLLALLVAGVQAWRSKDAYRTGVGEQQLVVLEDGTRMSLNTDTRARVDVGPSRRSVEVTRGEALFEVARDPRRPFVVRVAGSEVVAHGTAFAVRYDAGGADDGLEVTLIEGRVTVEDGTGSGGAPIEMQPGEKVRLAGEGPHPVLRVDHPDIDRMMAWKRSEAVFDASTLSDAVAEMNRYSRAPIVLVGPGVEDLRVSGVYHVGDSAGFARAVAALHGLALHERQGRLELAKAG